MADAKKDLSPLVQSVLALDGYFSDLERLGAKLNTLDMKSEFDFEHAERLMNYFAECGQGVATEVTNLAGHLNEARARAELIAKEVSVRAELITARKNEQHKKMEEFRLLGEKVREMSATMAELRRPEGQVLTSEERSRVTMRLAEVAEQLNPLIEEARNFRKDGQTSKIKALEQSADSLTQTLQVIQQKLASLS